MEIREQDLPLAQHRALAGQWLLDLDDHLRPLEDFRRAGGDRRPHRGVLGIPGAYAIARAVLHEHLVAVQDHFIHAVRRESYAVFVVLDLFGYSDEHGDGLPVV